MSLVVLTSGDRHKTDVSITDFEPKDSQGRGIGETQHQLIYICPKYVNPNTKVVYREWLEAIDDTLDHHVDETQYQRPIIQDIFKTIEEDNTTPQEYARMKEEHSSEEYHRKKYQEGIDAGIKQSEQQLKREKRAKEKANQEKEIANQEKEKANQEKEIANQEKEKANQEKEIANQEKEIANQEKEIANQEKEKANQERETERLEKERLIKILKQAGLDY